VFLHQVIELCFIEQSNQLTEQACTKYMGIVLLLPWDLFVVGATNLSHEEDTFQSVSKSVFGQICLGCNYTGPCGDLFIG